MSPQRSVLPEITSLAQNLRQQVAESRRTQPVDGRKKPSNQASRQEIGLQDKLLSLLDLIDQIEQPKPHLQESDHPPAGESAGLTLDQLLSALDNGLAHWQSKITLAYEQNASQELGDQLKQAKALHESLQTREERLDAQRQQFEQSLAKLLQREARTSRQRAAIAQSLRAQKAEMLLEVEILRQEQEQIGQIRQELMSEIGSTQSSHQQELESLRNELAETRQQLLEMEDNQTSQADKHSELLKQLEDELTVSNNELEQTNLRLQELEGNQNTQADENSALLKELHDELDLANRELETLRQQQQSLPETPLLLQEQADTIAKLKSQLQTLEQQLEDLHVQNSDLAAQVAKQQVISSGTSPHLSFQQESLSWEERKKLIMQQLEDESGTSFDVPSDDQVERHLEIEQLLLTTQTEIDKRDREIAELTAIVEQQSDTRQGVAIGAAAFAQAFDNDDIIQQERAKLKEIQREWEEKLRQAEVDVSLERAKLARERLQLEQELQNTEREKSAEAQTPDKAKKRKWLEHLGLRDENRGDK